MRTNNAELKMKYLGDGFIGQDLCECRIDITKDAVIVSTRRAGRIVSSKFLDSPGDVFSIKMKIQGYLRRARGVCRWTKEKTRLGLRMVIYYPSRDWRKRTGKVLWMVGGAI